MLCTRSPIVCMNAARTLMFWMPSLRLLLLAPPSSALTTPSSALTTSSSSSSLSLSSPPISLSVSEFMILNIFWRRRFCRCPWECPCPPPWLWPWPWVCWCSTIHMLSEREKERVSEREREREWMSEWISEWVHNNKNTETPFFCTE